MLVKFVKLVVASEAHFLDVQARVRIFIVRNLIPT